MDETPAEQAAREALNALTLREVPALLTTLYGAGARRDWEGALGTLAQVAMRVDEARKPVRAALLEEERARHGS